MIPYELDTVLSPQKEQPCLQGLASTAAARPPTIRRGSTVDPHAPHKLCGMDGATTEMMPDLMASSLWPGRTRVGPGFGSGSGRARVGLGSGLGRVGLGSGRTSGRIGVGSGRVWPRAGRIWGGLGRPPHTPSYSPLEPVYSPFYSPFYSPMHSCQHLAHLCFFLTQK